MKQKGRRFYVEEPTKKASRKREKIQEPEITINEQNFDQSGVEEISSNSIPQTKSSAKADFKREQRMKQQVSKKLEKNRKKAEKERQKQGVEPEVTVKEPKYQQPQSNVIEFKTEKHESKQSRFSDFMSKLQYNKKSIVLCAIIILVLLLSVLIFSNRDRLSFSSVKNWVEYGVLNKNSEEAFPVSTDGDVINNGNFSRIDRNLVYASDTKFSVVNNYGRSIYTNPQAYSSPVLAQAADSDLSLVYNLGGTGFSIYNLDSTIFSGEAQDNIVVADIAKDGTYALVTAKDGYLSKLYIYSEEHKQIYAYSFADYYITSVSLDNKGETAVLSGVSAHDGKQISAVYVLDFTKEEPVVFKEFENNILYYVGHLSDNSVCIIGESATYTLNLFTKNFKETLYEGKTLTAFDINTDTNTYALSLSRSGDGRKCDVLIFTTSGTLRNTISTELKITSLSTYKNRVAALSDGTVYLYSKNGASLSETDAGLDPGAVVLYSTNDAYILGVSEIRRLDL